jgi:hypothetical protein
VEPVLLLTHVLDDGTSPIAHERCTVRFAHGGWTEANVEARKKFGDWHVMLDRFAALSDSEGRVTPERSRARPAE